MERATTLSHKAGKTGWMASRLGLASVRGR